jgi:hypothetical protein
MQLPWAQLVPGGHFAIISLQGFNNCHDSLKMAYHSSTLPTVIFVSI